MTLGGLNARASRRWLAGLMILGFISAQLISLAHACATGPDRSPASAHAFGGTAAMPADCPMVVHAAPSDGTACDAHCLPSAQVDKGAEARIAAMAPPSPLIVRVVQPAIPSSVCAPPPLARIASPPLSLLFGRFLI
jgi:hypothetical protein